jgi:AcrR family transcriptional regulator
VAAQRLTGEQRRAQIVAVTLQLISDHGVQGTSTKRIAAAAGVSEATLYRHFASRNDIFLAALDAVYERVYELIDSSQGPDAVARLWAIGRGHLELHSSQHADFVFPLFEFIAAPPELGLRATLGRKQVRAVAAIAAIVAGGIADGSVLADVDPQRAAWELISVFWLRDVAYLMDLGHSVYEGSSVLMDTILQSISA